MSGGLYTVKDGRSRLRLPSATPASHADTALAALMTFPLRASAGDKLALALLPYVPVWVPHWA